ncbi:hypothetical protein WG66_004793 [Moniliophthora roreri]|nr:hypothetical protein WG66_004793 [Moniliophthora roreri]
MPRKTTLMFSTSTYRHDHYTYSMTDIKTGKGPFQPWTRSPTTKSHLVLHHFHVHHLPEMYAL